MKISNDNVLNLSLLSIKYVASLRTRVKVQRDKREKPTTKNKQYLFTY